MSHKTSHTDLLMIACYLDKTNKYVGGLDTKHADINSADSFSQHISELTRISLQCKGNSYH